MMTERDILLQKIRDTKEEIESAGPVHRRDLVRHVKRLIRQLRQMDQCASAKTSA